MEVVQFEKHIDAPVHVRALRGLGSAQVRAHAHLTCETFALMNDERTGPELISYATTPMHVEFALWMYFAGNFVPFYLVGGQLFKFFTPSYAPLSLSR